MVMEVEQPYLHTGFLSAPAVITAILEECSAITDYRTLRDTLPRRLASVLRCRSVLLYQRVGETLQFASGTFDDKPGWSASLLAVAHINPIDIQSNLPEAVAWRERRVVTAPAEISRPMLVAVPLLYRQKGIGVLVAIRTKDNDSGELAQSGNRQHSPSDANAAAHRQTTSPYYWLASEVQTLEAVAGIVALLLENTRLLERDRERIRELALLNSISSQMNSSLYEWDRMQSVIIQRTREIAATDLCAVLRPSSPTSAPPSWLPAALQEKLYRHFNSNTTPLLIERPGDEQTQVYMEDMPPTIKTFFAFPLLGARTENGGAGFSIRGAGTQPDGNAARQAANRVYGIVVGAYQRPWKLRREELVMLQMLASQAGAALENTQLMAEVMEARNEARKLLRQVLEDVATMRRLEGEKRRLDRLASLGEMSASVAHEVRNPLASIKTSMQMLMDDLVSEAEDGRQAFSADMNLEAQESIAVVLKEVERLDSIVRDLLLFARPRQLHLVPCDLSALSDHVLDMMQGQCADAGVTVRRCYAAIPAVQADIAQMEQVLFNLFANAIQAMPEGGTLTVSCRLVAGESAEAGRQWLEFSVSDTGSGIGLDQRERIFQPFFTTRAHGIGLGLSITRRLIEDHGGSIRAEGLPGRGATFILRLPVEGERREEAEHDE